MGLRRYICLEEYVTVLLDIFWNERQRASTATFVLSYFDLGAVFHPVVMTVRSAALELNEQ